MKSISEPLLKVSSKHGVGVLYDSFKNMNEEIESLIAKEYQAKLLNQEINHCYLCAQINPHFYITP